MLDRPLLERLYHDIRDLLAGQGSEMPPPATPEDLELFEAAFDVRLPGSYRYFLGQQDGWFGEFWQGFMLPGLRAWLADDSPASQKLREFRAATAQAAEAVGQAPLGFAVDDGRMLFFLDDAGKDGELPVAMVGEDGAIRQQWPSFRAFLEAALA